MIDERDVRTSQSATLGLARRDRPESMRYLFTFAYLPNETFNIFSHFFAGADFPAESPAGKNDVGPRQSEGWEITVASTGQRLARTPSPVVVRMAHNRNL